MPLLDIVNSNAFQMTTMAAAIKKIPYKPFRLGPGGLALFDEQAIETTTVLIEQIDGQLSLIPDSPRGSDGDYIGDSKAQVIPFVARHLKRNAKIFADEVQGVRLFGTEDQTLSVEAKRDQKLRILQAMHEVTWEFHRVGAITNKVLDADGSKVLLDICAAFGVSQPTVDYEFSDATLDIRDQSQQVGDAIDAELGGSTYTEVRAFCGATFYDTLIKHKFVQDALKAQAAAGAQKVLSDLSKEFTIGAVTYERAKRWRIKNNAGTMIDMIDPNQAWAVPIGADTQNGPMFIGRFAPQPFFDCVNRLNPPLVVKADADPKGKWIDMEGVSCPLYLNTRPRAVIQLTKS